MPIDEREEWPTRAGRVDVEHMVRTLLDRVTELEFVQDAILGELRSIHKVLTSSVATRGATRRTTEV